MPTTVDCLAHIPGIQIAGATSAQIGSYTLYSLPFEEWLEFEDPALDYQQHRYERNRPVFVKGGFVLEGHLDADRLSQEVREPFEADLARLSYALLFTLWDPTLPDPSRSTTYFGVSDGDQRYTFSQFGLNERDLILMSYSKLPQLNRDEIDRLTLMFNRLSAAGVGESTPELLRVIDAVKVAAQPGMALLEDMVTHFVAAHEDILNPKGDKPLGPTFGQRAALLFCPDFESLTRWQRLFKLLYDVRSDVLHGREVAPKLAEAEALVTSLYRFLFLLSYQTCCHLAFLASEKIILGTGLVGPMKTLGAVTPTSFARFKGRLHVDWLEV